MAEKFWWFMEWATCRLGFGERVYGYFHVKWMRAFTARLSAEHPR
jgi:hypothetical protein